MEKLIKIQNTSRKDFSLNLEFVTPKKVLDLKPNTILPITTEEYSYLITQCPKTFEKGMLKVVDIDEKANVEIVESKDIMSNKDIDELMDLSLIKFKNSINKIETLDLLKDIRQKAVEVGKTDKFLEAVDNRISEVANGSILL